MNLNIVKPNGSVEKLDNILKEAPFTLDINLNYFNTIFMELSKTGILDGLTVFITRKLDTVPRVGNDVLVILIGDEWCRIPDYVNDVKAVIKCMAGSPAYGYSFNHNFNKLQFISLLNGIRISKNRLPSLIKNGWRSSAREKILHIPLGYYKQHQVEWIPVNKREIDVYFAGSLSNSFKRSWFKSIICSPKTISREQMISEIQKFSNINTNFQVQIDLTEEFLHADKVSKYNYSEQMMNSKICLVPRGTSFESFRFFEALRFGCIVICEDLPHASFYDGAPVYRLYDWKELHSLLPKLLNNPELLEELQSKSLDWWKNHCCESAVSKMIYSHFQKL